VNYKQWVDLFGTSADDAAVRAVLTSSGINSPIKIGKDELSTREDIAGEGTTIVFTDETILKPNDSRSLLGRPIISAVLMILDQPNKNDLYQGPLPYHLNKNESQAALRARLGTPSKINDKYRTDAWEVDGMILATSYAKDLKSLTKVSLKLPNSR